jgi:hypothetical protein
VLAKIRIKALLKLIKGIRIKFLFVILLISVLNLAIKGFAYIYKQIRYPLLLNFNCQYLILIFYLYPGKIKVSFIA